MCQLHTFNQTSDVQNSHVIQESAREAPIVPTDQTRWTARTTISEYKIYMQQ